MVGKASRGSKHDAGFGKRCEKFFRVCDSRKREHLAAAQPGDDVRVRPQARLQDWNIGPARALCAVRGAPQLSNDDERMGAPELRLEWRAQRPSGDDLPVAGTAPAVDHQHRKILEKRWMVEA